MIPSIRTFLLINLLLGITVVFSLAIIGNIVIEHRTLNRHLDSELASTAYIIQGVFNDDVGKQTLVRLQNKVEKIPSLIQQLHCFQYGYCYRSPEYFQKVQFQIWDRNNKLLLKSQAISPRINPIHKSDGFHIKVIKSKKWRYFISRNLETGLTVVTAERHTFRDHLREKITQNSILILLITYPFLGLLIWVIVGRGLDSIRQVTKAVHKRAAIQLQPVNIEMVPPEIKPLVYELNKLFERLHAAFQREKRFASNAAHELRTPLAALRTQAQVALSAEQNSERNTALQKVLEGVDRSTHIVQQLLTLSRISSDSLPKEAEPVILNKEAATVIVDLATEAMKKKIEIELQADQGDKMIKGSSAAINILLRNLIDNAIRYTPEKGLVQVVVGENKKGIFLKVIDNGPGIPVKQRARVFERFYRIVGTKANGSGLGLSIVQQIAKLHKAKIELATPEDGIGLEVRVYFKKPD